MSKQIARKATIALTKIALATLIAISVSACEGLIQKEVVTKEVTVEKEVIKEVTVVGTYTVTGRAVNAKADSTGNFWVNTDAGSTETLVGTTVTLVGTSTYTTTVGSDGTFVLMNVPNGTYALKGLKSGWVFVSDTKFSVTANSLVAPDLIAFPESKAGALTVIMSWQNRTTDMDLHMTFGEVIAALGKDDLPGDNPDAESKDDYSTTHVGRFLKEVDHNVANTGILSFTAKLERDISNTTSDPTNFITTIPLVECISVYENPTSVQTINPYDGTGNDGDFRIYVNAFKKKAGTTGLDDATDQVVPAGTTIRVFQKELHLGTYHVPYNTAEQTLRMAVIDMNDITEGTTTFKNVATVWTEIITETNVRSIAPAIDGIPVKAFE